MASDELRFLGDPAHPVKFNCDILNKEAGRFQYVQYMFDRTNRMFRYQGLPDTIPEPMLEYMLQIYGSVAIIKYSGDLYAMRANFGGPPDPYYRPSQAVIANPALGLSGTYKVVNHLPPFDRTLWNEMEPCVRFINDTQIIGLMPLFARYAAQMTENDISIRCAQINLRQQSIIAADNGMEVEAANLYIKNLESGKLSAIGKRAFLDGISVTNASMGQSNTIMQLIELQQYLKASWYNEIGLNSNFNMKRQYVSSDEINASADIMLPLIDNMFECRKQAIDAINKEFGTEITVEKDSAWEKKQLQSDLSVVPESGNYPEQEAALESQDESIEESEFVNNPSEESSQLDSAYEDSGESESSSNTEETETESSDSNSDIIEEIGDAIVKAAEIAVAEILDEEGGEDEDESVSDS